MRIEILVRENKYMGIYGQYVGPLKKQYVNEFARDLNIIVPDLKCCRVHKPLPE
jgi:hypothetical protein